MNDEAKTWKDAYEEEARKFQAETRRTSALSLELDACRAALSQGEPHAGSADEIKGHPGKKFDPMLSDGLSFDEECRRAIERTSPPQAGAKEAGALTDAEIVQIAREVGAPINTGKTVIKLARAILAKSGAGEARDAARWQWLSNLKCNSWSLSRDDDHACNYMTASDWIDGHPQDFDDTPPDEVQRMRDTNTIWRLQVYPNTPVGFNLWCGATAEFCIDAAMTTERPT